MATKTKKKPITDEIATAQKDITRYYIGSTLTNPDTLLSTEGSGQGVKLYEDMLYEARIFSEMQKRKLAVISKEWGIEPASDSPEDQKIADFVEQVFKKMPYDRNRQSLLSGLVTGFKAGEVMWDYSEGDIWIKEIKGRSPRRFVFDLEQRLRLLTWGNMLTGEELPDNKFVIFRNPSDNDSPYGDALGRPLYWCQWFKKNGVKFWAVFLEKFGQPTPWGKYPTGTETANQDKLLDALKAMQTDQAIITPDTMTVELLEASRSSSVDSYEKWEKFWNDSITFIILGQTATTEGTPGKLGSEEARSQVADWIIKADADLLCEMQNQTLIPWLVDYNFPNVREYPRVWIRTEPEQDLKPLAERDRIIVKEIGLPTAKKYFYDTYGIPEPEPDEELVTVPQTPAPFGFAEDSKQKAVGSKQKAVSTNRSFAEVDFIAAYMESLGPSLKNIKIEALAKIEAWLQSQSAVPTAEEFVSAIRGILGNAYKNIDLTAITDSVSNIYQAYKAAPGVAVAFGGADIRAVNFLSKLDQVYLSKFVENPDAQSALTQFLKERYLEGGEGIFGRGNIEAIKSLQNVLAQKMTDLEGYQINRIVDTGVQRIRNWGHIAQMNDAAIAEIEIIEPTMECPFCSMMNGKTISVPVAYKNMMDQSNMNPDEYIEFLKNNPPDIENIESYVDQGMLPPYHPHCRGSIIKRISNA